MGRAQRSRTPVRYNNVTEGPGAIEYGLQTVLHGSMMVAFGVVALVWRSLKCNHSLCCRQREQLECGEYGKCYY